ncbi:auxin efflux carrier, partial [Tanacetum coccineum]
NGKASNNSDVQEKEEEHKERCDYNVPVCKIRRFEMIKYSFGQDEEYVAIKECEYDDLIKTNEVACRTFQEIFHSMDEGWVRMEPGGSISSNLVDKIRNIDGKIIKEGKLRSAMRGVVKVGSYVESLDGRLHAKDSGLPPNKTMPPINEDASEIFGEPAASVNVVEDNMVNQDTTTKSTAFTFSFANILNCNSNPNKKIVKIQELRNPERVDGALLLTLWMLLKRNSELKKDAIKSAPLWVKLHHVPIVAYSEIGLSLITTQLGKPIMLDSGGELKIQLFLCYSLSNGKGHTLAKIEVEYEWNPPRCNTCKVFDHVNDKCPKNPKVDAPTKAVNDGFTVVTKRKLKPNQKNKQVEGVRLSKPALNLQYRRVDKTDSSRIIEKVNNEPINLKTNGPIPKKINVLNIPTQNSFGALTYEEGNGRYDNYLNEEEWIGWEELKRRWCLMIAMVKRLLLREQALPLVRFPMINVASWNIRGLNFTPKQNEVRQTSNGAWCSKGTRIILGWNHNEVDVTIINQTDQAVHSRLWLKKEKKEIFCTFVYAHNKYNQRRDLWNALCLHKVFVNNRPWCLLGDFNATLHLSESTASSSCIDIAMREFKDCVNNIEVLDVQNTGLQFTWNQKPKGTDGILKKLDRKLKNLKKPLRKLLIDKGNLHANVERIRGELDTIQTQLDMTGAAHMVRMVTDREIKDAMFSMGDEKSPGPDGFSAAFFKEAWHIVGVDVINAIREFFTNGKLLKELNHTIIALIPKHASGLIPSIPKSTAFFCNVLNHVKLSILNVLPFEEGRLPVKYLGVPLVSSRLKARDCKELVEKVQNRVLDWKNKALSIAVRLKVRPKWRWELVCLPKEEESLWVKWVHAYKLNGRNFWDVPIRGNMSWSWRKILQLRPSIRDFIWRKIAYFIWQERNWRLFKKSKRSIDQGGFFPSGVVLPLKFCNSNGMSFEMAVQAVCLRLM